eukprot:365011-Chlamydomonas_euryale.AAC.13
MSDFEASTGCSCARGGCCAASSPAASLVAPGAGTAAAGCATWPRAEAEVLLSGVTIKLRTGRLGRTLAGDCVVKGLGFREGVCWTLAGDCAVKGLGYREGVCWTLAGDCVVKGLGEGVCWTLAGDCVVKGCAGADPGSCMQWARATPALHTFELQVVVRA